MIERTLYLTRNEWLVAVSRSGVSNIVCFEEMFVESGGDQDIAEGIVSLTAKGLVHNVGGRLETSDELRRIIRHLSATGSVAVERKKQDIYPVSCIYFTRADVLIAEMDRSSEPRIGLRFCPIDDYIRETLGYRFMPVRDYDLPECYRDHFPDMTSLEKTFAGDGSLLLLITAYDVTGGAVSKRIIVKTESLCDILFQETGSGEQVVSGYSKGEFTRLIMEIADSGWKES